MSVYLFHKFASGALIIFTISLLCVGCRWQDAPIGQVSVGTPAVR